MEQFDKMEQYEKEHFDRLLERASECMVLLKKRGDFPLQEAGKIALYGSGARKTIKGGTGSGDVNSRFYYTCEQGLEELGFTVTTKSWLDGYDKARAEAHKRFLEDIKAAAKKAHVPPVFFGMGAVMPEPEYELPLDGEGEVAVYVLSRISGEGNDRRPVKGDVKLTDTEIRDILALNSKYRHFMLVLNVGGVVDLSPVNHVENILIMSQLGVVTGLAFANVLLGRAVPSGKLATTWSAWGDYPEMEFGDADETRYREGIFVGYRWFDTAGKTPLYPFGHGLGYTDFKVSDVKASVNGAVASVWANVENTGKYDGREVVQVYVSSPSGRLPQPYQALAAFKKTASLAPGEKETVELCFNLADISSYDTENTAWILEKGDYIVRVGTSSRCTSPAAVLRLADTVTVRKVSSMNRKPDFEDLVLTAERCDALDGVPVINIDAAAFASLKFPEPVPASDRAKNIAAGLTDRQLCELCIGRYPKGVGSIIGMASQRVAGAAGETNSAGDTVGLVMADGPAGLRLSRQYYTDKDGAHSVGNPFPEGLEELLTPFQRKMIKKLHKQPKGEVKEQYCTAIPIGTAIAQSFDPGFAELCGDIAGAEMEIFGVQLWLAPALNIHRSILCGRNFEYYSEDPFISGVFAAGITKGVQKHKNCGVTIKHFACNSQETNRLKSDSILSERALREIYLRGFELCVRESDPAAVMTSYNLVNGIHTSEYPELLKTVLRGEWGYRGLIMTDWVIFMIGKGKNKNKNRIALSAPTVKAGNDIFMPGCDADLKGMLNALKGKDKDCRLERADLEACAARVIDMNIRLGQK